VVQREPNSWKSVFLVKRLGRAESGPGIEKSARENSGKTVNFRTSPTRLGWTILKQATCQRHEAHNIARLIDERAKPLMQCRLRFTNRLGQRIRPGERAEILSFLALVVARSLQTCFSCKRKATWNGNILLCLLAPRLRV